MSRATEIEAAAFKPVEGGYLYQAPNPWLFGRGRRYIVSEAQKNELIAIMTPRRPILRVVVITGALLAWVIVAAALFAFLDKGETALNVGIFVVEILAPMYFAVVVALYRQLGRIRPILAAAVPSHERITWGERWRASGRAMSSGKLALLAGVFALNAIIQAVNLVTRHDSHPLFTDAVSYLFLFATVTMAGLAALYLWLLFRKRHEQKPVR